MRQPNRLCAQALLISSAAAAVSTAALFYGAATGYAFTAWFAALAFAAVATAAALSVSPQSSQQSLEPVIWVRCMSAMTALVYFWGGLALNLIYKFSGLHWQHGWEYGLAMILISAGLAAYSYQLRDLSSALAATKALERVIHLAGLHGLAAMAALVWLAWSGKLHTPKDDWAANIIFVSGGLAVASISAVTAYRLRARE